MHGSIAPNLHHTTEGEAAHACLDCPGGYGYAAEYDVECTFRETRLYKTAPVHNNLVLAYIGQHVLGMPRSY
jgi:acyl-CoA dehydrogenase